MKLNSRGIHKVTEHILYNTGIVLTDAQVIELLKEDPDTKYEIERFGLFDTTTKECISNMISYHILGKEWPTYGDNIPIEEWINELHSKAQLMGYSVKTV